MGTWAALKGHGALEELGAYVRAKNIVIRDANVFLGIYHLHRRSDFDKSLSTM